MNLEFKDDHEGQKYNEVPQANQIRWQVYKQEKPGKYVSVTGKFKCKDFFNDIVTAFQGKKEFEIYGFKSYPTMLNKDDKEGVPIIVTGLVNRFEANVEVANGWLADQGFPKITVERFPEEKEALIYVPWEFFKNTYYISAITLLLRVCNYGDVKLKDDIKEALEVLEEHNPDKKLFETLLQKRMDKLGDTAKYIWWYKEEMNYENMKDNYNFKSLTHNCGINNWTI